MSIQQAMEEAAWKSANEQIKAAKEAEKGSSGSTSNAPKIDSKKDKQKKDLPQLPTTSSGGGGGGSHSLGLSDHKLVYASLKAYASGTTGISHAEKNALVSEYGQTEMTVLPNGNTIITDEPTMMDLPKGTVIYNEGQTKQIMDNKVNTSGKSHANGTNDWWIGSDGHRYRDIQPGERAYELQKVFEPLLNRWLSGEQEIQCCI